MIGTRIIKAARCVPEFVVTNEDLSRIVDTNDEWIYSRTGIKTRHISKGETVSDLAAGVFRKLTEGTGVGADDIDVLILSTVTPDYMTPQASAFVLNKVGAKNAFAFDLNAACTGFVYAFSVADKLLRSGVYKTAMVISADTLSKIVDWTDRSSCVLFGDGAGGVLLRAEEGAPGVIAEDLHSDGELVDVLGGGKLPLRNAWYRDETDVPYVTMDGHAVYNFSIRETTKSVFRLLEKTGLTMEDITYIVPHQANIRIIEGIAKKLKADESKFFKNIETYGNTSSSSIPIALSEMFDRGLLHTGDKVIFLGFGGGLTWGSVLFQI